MADTKRTTATRECIMDYPQAWAFVRETELDSHDPRCSYRIAEGGLLCDCFILNDEYARRKALISAGQ